MNAGATPKVIRSAKLSNCLPNSPSTFSIRAIIPSKKSRKAPNRIKPPAMLRCPPTANKTASNPQNKLPKVNKLGMCFSIIMRYLSCNNTKDVSHYIISHTFWFASLGCLACGRFSVSTLYCFCTIITAGNELQKRKSVFAHTFLAFMLWNILTTFWIVHATWFGVMMAVLSILC